MMWLNEEKCSPESDEHFFSYNQGIKSNIQEVRVVYPKSQKKRYNLALSVLTIGDLRDEIVYFCKLFLVDHNRRKNLCGAVRVGHTQLYYQTMTVQHKGELWYVFSFSEKQL